MSRVRLDPSSRMPIETQLVTGGLVEELRAALTTRPSRYVELTARSNFSFLQAASRPEELVARARELGYDALAITDKDGLYGIVRAHEEAARQGIRLVVGCELTIEPAHSLTVHVESQDGYTNLCRILTESHGRHPKGDGTSAATGGSADVLSARRPTPQRGRHLRAGVPLATVCDHAAGLWALAGSEWDDGSLASLHRAFGPRLSLGVHLHRDGEDRARMTRVLEAANTFGIPVCATNQVRYARREQKPVHDVLHCIREGTTLDSAGRALSPNAEAHLKSEEEMARLFASHPALLARSRRIADACLFSIKELRYRFPYEIEEIAGSSGKGRHVSGYAGAWSTPEAETADQALRRLTMAGALDRYSGEPPEKVKAQIDKELSLIEKLEVAPYFLSVHAIVQIARRRDILCQGRGSAANSAVCFCLGITAVDPARSNLLFERFLSAERKEPPDIDVDFEHERREEVIQEIYARYGRDRAAMVSEIISYRGKSALRDVGKVFGLSLEQVDRLSAVVSWWDGIRSIDNERLENAGFSAADPRVRSVIAMAYAIQGYPRHLSIHVGGFVLSASPLVLVAPIEPATMPDRTVIPWDKDDLDTLGFFKVDVLALGMLTAVRKALDLIGQQGQTKTLSAIDRLAKIPPEDPRVYDALCKADTVGVFQIESRAQMSMLPRLRPRTFYDLVVEVAIVRPGPIQGGMVHPYLRRRNGEESCDPPHPILGPILDRTLGVPLFQEQVMQIAIVGAGYSGGEADQLRRDMAAWRKNGRLARHKDRLQKGFAEHGIGKAFSDRLYAQIQGFGEYGFPESHAASFALLVYASSWLKVHHAAAFAAALVNSQPMGFYSPSTILQDAERHGVEMRAICIEKSGWDCTLEDGARAVRVGLRQVRGLGEEAGKRIEQARAERPFASIEDLEARAALQKNELSVLAEAGALAALTKGRGRREAIWKVHAPIDEGGPQQEALFAGKERPLEAKLPPLSRAEQLVMDYETTGISISDHPMRILRPDLPKGVKSSKELREMKKEAMVRVAGLVICRQRPATASGVVFVTMEDEHGFINLILWTKVFERFRHVATTSSLLMAHGKIERDSSRGEDVIYVVVDRLEPLRMPNDGTCRQNDDEIPPMSRDFH